MLNASEAIGVTPAGKRKRPGVVVGCGHARCSQCYQDAPRLSTLRELDDATARLMVAGAGERTAPDLVAALVDAIEACGFTVSGPTDLRAAEHGEPAWVCRAREAIAKAGAT